MALYYYMEGKQLNDICDVWYWRKIKLPPFIFPNIASFPLSKMWLYLLKDALKEHN